MILAIDVGNTNTSVGCMDGGEVLRVFRISTNIALTIDECAADLKKLLDFHDMDAQQFDGAVISCVVPPLTRVIKSAVKLLTGTDAIVVGTGVKTGLNILIDDPAQLGGDMVATAVGAMAAYEPPMIIIDMGTATKMYVINKNGGFIGGAIAPGISLSADALAVGTSQLPKVPIEAPAKCISANTIDCMKSGTVYGAASMIDGMTERFEDEMGESAQLIVTGGLAEAVYRHCKRSITHDQHLILRGLEIIYEKNKRK